MEYFELSFYCLFRFVITWIYQKWQYASTTWLYSVVFFFHPYFGISFKVESNKGKIKHNDLLFG